MSAEPTRQFVDTNVLVYAHDRSAGAKQARARTLIERLWNEGGGCLSVQVLQEFFVTITRKVPHPLDDASAETLVRHRLEIGLRDVEYAPIRVLILPAEIERPSAPPTRRASEETVCASTVLPR